MLRATFVLLCAATAPVCSQKLCDTLNPGSVLQTQPAPPGSSWSCISMPPIPAGTFLSAVEFALRLPTAGTVRVGVWDVDPVTTLPRNLLGSGTVTATAGVGGFYGTTIFAGLNPGQQYYAGVDTGGIAAPLAPANGGISAYYYLNPSIGWIGPGGGRWSIRVYCSSHTGSFANFGNGKIGSRGVPLLRGLGFPNTTNPITLQTSGGASGSNGVMLLGTRRAPIAIPPFGDLLVDPALTIPIVLRTGSDDGSFSLDFTVPNRTSRLGEGRASPARPSCSMRAPPAVCRTPTAWKWCSVTDRGNRAPGCGRVATPAAAVRRTSRAGSSRAWRCRRSLQWAQSCRRACWLGGKAERNHPVGATGREQAWQVVVAGPSEAGGAVPLSRR